MTLRRMGSSGSWIVMSEQGVKKTVATEGPPKEDKEAGKAEATFKNVTAKGEYRRGKGI